MSDTQVWLIVGGSAAIVLIFTGALIAWAAGWREAVFVMLFTVAAVAGIALAVLAWASFVMAALS